MNEKPDGIRITRSTPEPAASLAIPTSAPADTPPARDELRHLPDGVADRLDQFAAEQKSAEPRRWRRQPAKSGAEKSGKSSPSKSEKSGKPGSAKAEPSAPALAPADATPRNAAAMSAPRPGEDEIRHAIYLSRSAFIGIGVLSFLINILMLTGPLFMLQVYDRVMTSGSMSTLLALSAMTALLYAMTGFFELIRTRIVSRVSVEIDQRLSDRIFKASLRRSLFKQGASTSALRDLDTVRQFASGPAPMTFFDAPWAPIYLLVIFLVHWMLGVAALFGMLLILALTLMSERTAREPLAEANKSAVKSLEMADSAQRNVEALAAMGMIEAYRKRWQKASTESLAWQISAADRLGSTASIGKAVRLLLQSFMLAVGAGLAINGDISAGSIIAGTIIFGRALAPLEQGVAQWKSFVKTRESFDKLKTLLREEPEPPVRTALPAPAGRIEIANLRVAAPDTRKLILANLNFVVKPGELCAVIGPSASGKSTLARTLVGLWPPFSGTISIDGADLQQWNPEALGRYIGYLPQDVELFSGTVRENISRFRDDAVDEAVIEAAQMAHAHEMILALPQGYDTQLGSFGTYLSAGQRQRIGLARALFGNPVFLVLDEPNANLDRLGDEALTSALAGMKKRGQAVILISHRVQAMSLADTLLYVDRGVQRAFGPQAEVMKLFRQNAPGQGQPQGPNPGQPAPTQQAQAQAQAQAQQARAQQARAQQAQSQQTQGQQTQGQQSKPQAPQQGQPRPAPPTATQPASQTTTTGATSAAAVAVGGREASQPPVQRTPPPPAQAAQQPRPATVVVVDEEPAEAPAIKLPVEATTAAPARSPVPAPSAPSKPAPVTPAAAMPASTAKPVAATTAAPPREPANEAAHPPVPPASSAKTAALPPSPAPATPVREAATTTLAPAAPPQRQSEAPLEVRAEPRRALPAVLAVEPAAKPTPPLPPTEKPAAAPAPTAAPQHVPPAEPVPDDATASEAAPLPSIPAARIAAVMAPAHPMRRATDGLPSVRVKAISAMLPGPPGGIERRKSQE